MLLLVPCHRARARILQAKAHAEEDDMMREQRQLAHLTKLRVCIL